MRIVSFLPSATEILYELGMGEYLVGVTHECDYPIEAKTKPIVIKSSIDCSKMSSKEIDEAITNMVMNGKDIYVINDEELIKARPDIIIAQGLCKVCSPYKSEIERALNILKKRPKVVMLEPHNLKEVLDSIIIVARELGIENKGKELVNKLNKRIEYVKSRIKVKDKRVLAIEWLDPLYTAGHWVPDMINIVGVNLISKSGEHSRRLDFEEIIKEDPDVIILMACGYDTKRIIDELPCLEKFEYWHKLKAVKEGEVYAVDASSYFNRPGPRLVTGIEILAKILHKDTFKELSTPKDSFKKVY